MTKTTDHPLTETRAAELWDNNTTRRRDWANLSPSNNDDTLTAMRAAYDEDREHEREDSDLSRSTVAAGATKADAPLREGEVREQIVTNDIGEWVKIETRANGYGFLHLGCGHMMNLDRETRAALEAALAVTPADPHHDPRPWQDCTRKDIRKGDLLEAQEDDILHVGVAHHKDNCGDWNTEGNNLLTYGTLWPLRRIPAPTPPAVEVELPTEHPAHLTDVEITYGARCAYMAIDIDGYWVGVDQRGEFRECRHAMLAACTLPDGTRARRDGEYADGRPRFVKVQEEQK